MTSRLPRRIALLLALLLLGACSGGDPGATEPSATPTGSAAAQEECDEVVDEVVALVQRYVDQYAADPDAGPSPGPDSETGGVAAPDLPRQLQQARSQLAGLGCDPEKSATTLGNGLEAVEADGALALAVKQQLVASLTGRVDQTATTERVGTDQDLRDVLPELAPGSTVRLAPGRHRLDDSVVLLRGVTLVGAGRGRTVVTSTAAEAAVLALTPERVELRDLTLRHGGERPASLVVGSSTTRLVLDGVELLGARAAKGDRAGANGGTGVLMTGTGAKGGRETTLEVTDSRFRDLDASGILLGGRHVASVETSTFEDTGQCGVCFTGRSGGVVRDSQFRGSVTGVIAAGRAAPLVVDSSVSGAEIGLQAVDRASPVVRGTTIAGSERTALLFSDRTRGRVEDVTCRGSDYGIVVGPSALPFIGDNRCRVAPTG